MEPAAREEGFIQFELEHDPCDLAREEAERIGSLLGWRRILRRVTLLGQEPGRYDGAGFGNLSARADRGFAPPGRRAFLITGTQTSGIERVEESDFAVVDEYDYRRNRVRSHGASRPSSEAMTHGAIYDVNAAIRAVFHVHSPEIWSHAKDFGLPTTAPAVGYGTPEMAAEVGRLLRRHDLERRSLLVMGGHLDGVMVFGGCAEEAGEAALSWLARAYGAGQPISSWKLE